MTPSEHLRLAAALIADEKRWTQETLARDVVGEQCDPNAPWASQWCALGALTKILQNTAHQLCWDESYEFINVYGNSLNDLNDHYGHAYTIGAMMHVADKLDGLA